MQDAIAALEKAGHIQQIHDGCWLFKALLAPKPHQAHARHIDKFIWRFWLNYILLNSVTWIIAYPIPHCDFAINEEVGLGIFFWLWDAPMGYHQLAVALASQDKLAFQGPNAIKWTYTVMPFGQLIFWQRLSVSYMMLTANRKPSHSKKVLSLMTIQIQRSLSTTFSAGQSCLTRPCCTLNANFVFVRPTNFC
jgi:hypothetical protein